MVYLVTGYTPFLSHAENPSEKVARLLHDTPIHSTYIQSHICPVDTHGARFVSELLKHNPNWSGIVHLGLDATANKIYVETDALNAVATRTPCLQSRRGDVAFPHPIDTNAPVVLPTTFPCQSVAMQTYLMQCQPKASWSRDPGTYFCNEQYFRTLHVVRTNSILMNKQHLLPVVFVHLPPEDAVYTIESMAQFVLGLLLSIKQ